MLIKTQWRRSSSVVRLFYRVQFKPINVGESSDFSVYKLLHVEFRQLHSRFSISSEEAGNMEGTTNEISSGEVNSDSSFVEPVKNLPQGSSDAVYVNEQHVVEDIKDEDPSLEEIVQPMEGQEQYYEQQQQKLCEGEVLQESVDKSAKDPLDTAVENANLISESFAENGVTSVESELMHPKVDQIHVEECNEQEVEEGIELIEDTNAVIELPKDEIEVNALDNVDYDYSIEQGPTIIDKETEQIIIQEVNDDVSEEEIEIQTYTEDSADSEEIVRGITKPENLKLASSCTVQVQDGGTVQIELYKTTDSNEAKEEKESFKKVKAESSTQKSTPENKTPKQRKTRKSTYDIPMHVLGVDINKPIESANNGRPIPKPRIGVKVPYRNLTSQIVTKAEIEEEIMERSRQKQVQDKVASSFARSLTQRLAKKIITSTIDDDEEEKTALATDKSNEATEKDEKSSEKDDKIDNDSDLLAILEGEGDDMPMLSKEVPVPQEDETTLKALEREIALQQLQELPTQEPKPRIFKSRQVKVSVLSTELKQKGSTLTKSVSAPENPSMEKIATSTFTKSVSTPEESSKTKEPASTLIKARPNDKNGSSSSTSDKNKENTAKSTSKVISASKKDPYSMNLSPLKKSPIEIEPQVKVNMVLKTYSRKRKTSEPKDEMDEEMFQTKKSTPDEYIKQEESIDLKASPDVYITKSSRVIKKKVIWDPAEVQPRSPRFGAKSESTKTTPSKIMKSADKNANTEVGVEKLDKEKLMLKKVAPQDKRPKLVVSKVTKIPAKPKLSEVDKLLMDEGAVKMLYELNNDDRVTKPKKEFYDVEKVAKDIKKKANLLKNELEQTTSETQKSLRKKDGSTPTKSATVTERKISKDSTKSFIHTPPGSPFPQGSMLIRRRSSSSISSSDDTEVEEGTTRASRRKTESAKKEKKTTDEAIEVAVENTRNSRLCNQFKSFTIKRTGKHVAIDLHYIDEKCYFTVQVLDELTTALRKFSTEKDILVVTLSSSNEAFCLGIEYSQLVSDKESERTEKATELAYKVREFLLCLLHFPKILIACIQGKCQGLGVTMLPLFDIVLATDKATFETPYANMGCMSEAGFLLTYPFLMNHGLAAELLYIGQKLTADDASKRGLVKLCWPEKFKTEIKNVVAAIMRGSKQSLESIKQQLHSFSSEQAEAAITKESQMLIEHWTSPECQSAFSSL